MRVLLIALLAAISYAQTAIECQWQYGIPNAINTVHLGNDRRNLIVNGDITEPNEYPWHVDLNGCGATLVGREWVITAAHCFDAADSLDSLKDDPNDPAFVSLRDGAISAVALEVFIHPKYNDDSMETKFDIALIRISPLDCDVAIANGINAIQLLDDANGFDCLGCTAFLIGYGALFSEGDVPLQMLEVITEIHDYSTCNRFPAMVLGEHIIDDSQVCTFGVGTNEDTCQGDSGGPLYIDINNSPSEHTYVDAGVVSYGRGCGNTEPGIYTKIAFHKEWILDKFPAAPFVLAQVCDKRDYNEGPTPDEIGDEDLQYTPYPLYAGLNTEEFNSCELKYLTQSDLGNLMYATKFDECAEVPNCRTCLLDLDTLEPIGCLTCEPGYEVSLPLVSETNYDLKFGDPEALCAGRCVALNTNTQNNQASLMAASICSADPCLVKSPSGGVLDEVKYDDGSLQSVVPLPAEEDLLPISILGSESCESTLITTSTSAYYVPDECAQDIIFGGFSKATCVSEEEVNVNVYQNENCEGIPLKEFYFLHRECSALNDPAFEDPVQTVLLGAPCTSVVDATTTTSLVEVVDVVTDEGDGDDSDSSVYFIGVVVVIIVLLMIAGIVYWKLYKNKKQSDLEMGDTSMYEVATVNKLNSPPAPANLTFRQPPPNDFRKVPSPLENTL